MRALVFNNVGALPRIEDHNGSENGQVVALSHSALNHRDIWITKGLYPGIKPNSIMGSDGVGIYKNQRVIINPGLNWGNQESFQSKEFKVLGVPDNGTFAEEIKLNSSYIYDCPEYLSNEEAASLPLAGVTAYRVLVVKCNPKVGEKVLIHGIGGGVAMMAFLMALAVGCEVYVTSSSNTKINKAISLGARSGYNYNANWIEAIKSDKIGFDIIIDSAGGSQFQNLIDVCNYGARIGIYGASHGKIDTVNAQTLFWKQISIFGSTMGSDKDFASMIDFCTKYKIRPIISECYLIEDFAKGFHSMESGSQFGKIVFENKFN